VDASLPARFSQPVTEALFSNVNLVARCGSPFGSMGSARYASDLQRTLAVGSARSSNLQRARGLFHPPALTYYM
jgi:hypothetical protein